MKTALIIAILIAILALVATAVFAELRSRAVTLLNRRSEELKRTEDALKKSEAQRLDVSGTCDRLSDSCEELRAGLERMSKLAYYDANTDLPNRQRLAETFEEAKRAMREGEEIGLAMFEFRDEDGSPTTLLGRNNAEMRQEIVQRLRSSMNEDDDMLVCLSEDTFAVLTQRIAHRGDYRGKIDKLFKLLLLPVMNSGTEVTPLVFGAVVMAPENGDTMQLLDMNLGIALEEAMAENHSGYRFYTGDMAERAMDRMARQAVVTEAVRDGRVEYAVTPRVTLAGKRIRQLAITPTLASDGGVLGGRELLAGIDESGLAMVVYEAMLRCACDDLRRFSELGIADVRCVIPVTDRMFGNREFIKTTYDVLQHLDLDMRRVLFEVPEKAVARYTGEAAERMCKLADFGVRFILETRGIPCVHPAELKRMPIDAWVIRDAVPPEAETAEIRELLSAIAKTAHAFGAEAVLPDVATKEDAALAAECGYDVAQGTLYGDSLSGELAGQLLTAMK